eukprot:COSAG01_NODE_38063_length_494_cov_11.129848_1_plen_29_part_01
MASVARVVLVVVEPEETAEAWAAVVVVQV